MLTRMSDTSEHRPRIPASVEGSSVLAGLPRTRPQRVSARRVASRAAKSSEVAASKPRPKKRSQAKRRRPATESVPAQGYEAEPESLRGPVHPPGSAELVASAAELAGELAKAGVNTGARVLRDFLSRLPG